MGDKAFHTAASQGAAQFGRARDRYPQITGMCGVSRTPRHAFHGTPANGSVHQHRSLPSEQSDRYQVVAVTIWDPADIPGDDLSASRSEAVARIVLRTAVALADRATAVAKIVADVPGGMDGEIKLAMSFALTPATKMDFAMDVHLAEQRLSHYGLKIDVRGVPAARLSA